MSKGIDESQIKFNLSLSPTQRLEQHHVALVTVRELEKAREQLYGKSKQPAKKTP